MSRAIGIIFTALVAAAAGLAIGRYWPSSGEEKMGASAPAEREILYWAAPMDASYRRDGPGKSPMGMDLVPVYADQGDGVDGVVEIDPRVVSNLGVRTAKAQRSALPRKIDTVGYVQYDEETLYHVHTRVDGWVEELALKAGGEPVSKGQLLLGVHQRW